jgi:hypothetical protein
MTATSTVLALVVYPLLSSLPLNLVEIQWNFRHGLDPMPAEVRERAEAADRIRRVVIYVVLLALVVFLLRGSSISTYAVGLTIDNWKSAIELGALVGLIPLSVGSIWHRLVPPHKRQEEPESRGSLASWCGLTLLGSLSVELWRVYCITGLMRLDVSAWLAVLVVAIAYGASWLVTSTGGAVGAAMYGGVAGLLFVKTGSLLSPLTMGLIAGIAELYRVGGLPSQIVAGLVAFEHPVGGQTEDSTRRQRGEITCPICSVSFSPQETKKTWRTFACPNCEQMLTYETRDFDYLLFAFSVYGTPIALYFYGFRGLTLAAASVASAIVLLFLGTFIYNMFSRPTATQPRGFGGLRLMDKRKRRENHPPTDNSG